MALMAMGFSAINPKKISIGKGFGLVLAVWLFWVIVKVGLAAAFS
jgi:lipopolysaccharide export LptBFGC system permease protein LptF